MNESPFNSTTNMFLVQPNNGSPLTRLAGYNLTGFTIEPTGLAYAPSTDPNDPSKDLLYISDDDADRVYWVDPDNPQVKLGEFRTSLSGQTDAEDVAYDLFDGDPNGHDGHLYIANGTYANIREVTTNGTLVRTISLPSAITDPEALLWDDVHNVFFIGGKFSSNVWVLDGNGAILDTITLSPIIPGRAEPRPGSRTWSSPRAAIPTTIRANSASTSPTTAPTTSTMAACSRSTSAIRSGPEEALTGRRRVARWLWDRRRSSRRAERGRRPRTGYKTRA